jgi:F-type H+-transporting ATPase subunit b
MRFSLSLTGWFAAVMIAATLCSRAARAQGVEADAHAAAVEAAIEEEGGSGPNPLAVDPDLAIWTLVVFVVLFAILAKFAWPQIAAAVDERERKISATIAAADAKLEEAKRVLAEHEARLAATAGEVREMLDEARRDAETTKRRIEEDGRKAATEEIARATREIDRAKDGALQELAVRSAKLAIELGERVVRDQLQISPEHQQRIVRDALEKLSDAAAARN